MQGRGMFQGPSGVLGDQTNSRLVLRVRGARAAVVGPHRSCHVAVEMVEEIAEKEARVSGEDFRRYIVEIEFLRRSQVFRQPGVIARILPEQTVRKAQRLPGDLPDAGGLVQDP